jgi:hypothetical protein
MAPPSATPGSFEDNIFICVKSQIPIHGSIGHLKPHLPSSRTGLSVRHHREIEPRGIWLLDALSTSIDLAGSRALTASKGCSADIHKHSGSRECFASFWSLVLGPGNAFLVPKVNDLAFGGLVI